jgi:N-acetylglutamate synthase-like GNAT family acetyltransferase
MSTELTTRQISDLPTDIQVLIDESSIEGYRMIQRLKDEWDSGSNRFSKSGEAIWEVRHDGKLIGIGGLNQDPYSDGESVGRVRRMYVSKIKRRSGAGRVIVEHALEHAASRFQSVRVRSTPEAELFYDALGFARTDNVPDVTHELHFSV